MRQLPRLPFALISSALAAAGLLAACGGGSSTPTTSVSGSVIKGPVNGAQVCAFKAVAAGKGDQIKCVTTTSTGAYTMDIDYVGDVVIEASGGTYTDEATGATKTLSDPLQVVLNAQGSAATGVVTPLTSVAYSLSKAATGGVSSANFGTAATTVASQFQLSGVNIATAVPAVTGTTNAYGQILKAVSQYVANGNTLASFITFTSPTTIQVAFNSAYATANGATISFNLGGTTASTGTGTGTGTGTVPGTGTGSGTGTGTGTGTAAASCGITVAGTGTVVASGFTVPFTLPATKVCVTGVPAASCTAGNAQLQSAAAGGATPSGNYTLSYTYTYAPGDCTGAIATVAVTL
jgi:hypothetical protein